MITENRVGMVQAARRVCLESETRTAAAHNGTDSDCQSLRTPPGRLNLEAWPKSCRFVDGIVCFQFSKIIFSTPAPRGSSGSESR